MAWRPLGLHVERVVLPQPAAQEDHHHRPRPARPRAGRPSPGAAQQARQPQSQQARVTYLDERPPRHRSARRSGRSLRAHRAPSRVRSLLEAEAMPARTSTRSLTIAGERSSSNLGDGIRTMAGSPIDGDRAGVTIDSRIFRGALRGGRMILFDPSGYAWPARWSARCTACLPLTAGFLGRAWCPCLDTTLCERAGADVGGGAGGGVEAGVGVGSGVVGAGTGLPTRIGVGLGVGVGLMMGLGVRSRPGDPPEVGVGVGVGVEVGVGDVVVLPTIASISPAPTGEPRPASVL